jgi:hypothetical protein
MDFGVRLYFDSLRHGFFRRFTLSVDEAIIKYAADIFLFKPLKNMRVENGKLICNTSGI